MKTDTYLPNNTERTDALQELLLTTFEVDGWLYVRHQNDQIILDYAQIYGWLMRINRLFTSINSSCVYGIGLKCAFHRRHSTSCVTRG